MALDENIISIIACPMCKHSIKEVYTGKKTGLYCERCAVYFPIYEGIPVLLKKEAVAKEEWENS